MPFKPGQSGNPKGRPKSAKLIKDTLKLVLFEPDKKTGKRKIDLVAEAVVDCAKQGDMRAIKFIADRLDGKIAIRQSHPVQVFDTG